ncbi:hypothetical protein [Kitasatospora sp. NPDC058218]|uniref:hypothetical protein n=1 Tax=Kitasatospora sp. NPDC058218 TaxID=3346385 RepID=UPI0036D7F6BF
MTTTDDTYADAEIIEGELLDPEPQPAPPPPTTDAPYWYENLGPYVPRPGEPGPTAWPYGTAWPGATPGSYPAPVPGPRPAGPAGGYPPPPPPMPPAAPDYGTPVGFYGEEPPTGPGTGKKPHRGAAEPGTGTGTGTGTVYTVVQPAPYPHGYEWPRPAPSFPPAPPCSPCRPGSLPYCGGCAANPGGPVPVELVAPQPVPVMLVAPPAEPEPFWDFSWLQLGANATAAALAAVPAWLLHHYQPALTGNYGVDAAVAVALLWGGRPALRSLALAGAAYYACHWFHVPAVTTAAVELVAIALPLHGARRPTLSPLRRAAVWFPILAGCLSLPALTDAITWLTTAFTGGN